MTAFGHCLPAEVWLNIFHHIQNKRQLAKCKLVCKRWAPLAEMALLKTVVLTKTNLPKLYQHLLEHPQSARHIQVVDISKYPVGQQEDLFEFMALAVTPSLKAIDADMCSNEFLNTLIDLVSKKPKDSLKLERLPVTTFTTDTYVALVSLLKKTLQLLVLGFTDSNMRESIQYISSNLSSFESLTDLRVVDLIMYTNSVPKLEDMLKGCCHLKSLIIGIDQSPTRTATSNLDAWLLQNVQKVDSLEKLFIRNSSFGSNADDQNVSGGFYLDLLRYLSFKYPRVKHVSMNLYKQKSQPVARSVFENADTITLHNWKMDTMDHAEQTVDVWKSQNNSLSIQYRVPLLFSEEYACWINVDKDKEANHTKFELTNVSLQVPTERIKQLLSSLGNTLTQDLEIDFKEYQESELQLKSPLMFLPLTPYIQHLKVKSNYLAQKEPLAPLIRLHTLELEGTKLAAKDAANIASWAPHLKHLKLTSYSFTALWLEEIALLKQDLLLPELALDTLTMEGAMESQDLCISVAIASCPPQLFYAVPSRPMVRLTLEESKMHTRAATHITISCKSLKHLSVKLEDVALEMEFDKEGNVIDSKPAIVNSIARQLRQDLASSNMEVAQLKTEKQAIVAKYEQAKKYLTNAQIQEIEE